MRRRADARALDRIFLALAALALLVCSGATDAQERPAGPAAPRQVPNLAGRWELNAQESDSLQGQLPDRASGGRAGVFGGYGGGRGTTGATGGGFPGGGAGSGAPESSVSREQMQRLLKASSVLLIVQDETHLSLTDEDGRVVMLKPDGTKVKEQQFGQSIERTTKWDGRSLITSAKLKSGTKVTQTFSKISEGLQLVVVTKVEGGRLPRPTQFRRVYDQAFQQRLESPSAGR
jgi:hypothetical protein